MENDNMYVMQATYHNYNYGSSLQCYATQQYFRNRGISCYLVERRDKAIKKIIRAFLRRLILLIRCVKYPELIAKKKIFFNNSIYSLGSISEVSRKELDVFVDENIEIMSGSYNQLKKSAKNEKCILCVAGSDQIWNAMRIVIDPIYFLTFAPKKKRIAVAPSFGSSSIPSYNKKIYCRMLSGFNKLSVREQSGASLIQDLTGRTARVFLDPVFLHSRLFWMDFSSSGIETLNLGEYVLAFFLDLPKKKTIDKLKRLHNKGYKICTIGYAYDVFKIELNALDLDGGPQNFIKLIKDAKMIYTDSFHVTAFSTIFYKDFWVFKRDYTGNNQSTRLTDYLNQVNLLYRYECENSKRMDLTDEEINKINFEIKKNKINFEYYIEKEDTEYMNGEENDDGTYEIDIFD